MQAHVAKKGRGLKIRLPGAAVNIDPTVRATYDLPVVFLSATTSLSFFFKDRLFLENISKQPLLFSCFGQNGCTYRLAK
jgi:hypothetical protein